MYFISLISQLQIVSLNFQQAFDHGYTRRDCFLFLAGMHLMVICSTLFFLPKGHIKEIQMKTQTIHVDTIDAQLPPKTDTGKLGHLSTVDPQKYSLLIISSSPKLLRYTFT